MKKSLLVGLLSVSLISQAAGAEFPTKVQPKSMIPYLTHSIVVPPSPLKYQVLFIGGVHDVQTTPTYGKPAGATKAKQNNTTDPNKIISKGFIWYSSGKYLFILSVIQIRLHNFLTHL